MENVLIMTLERIDRRADSESIDPANAHFFMVRLC
jgi:hypothetical protein